MSLTFVRSLRNGLAAAVFSLVFTTAASAGILGHNVSIEFLFPDINTLYGLGTTGIVDGDGLSLDLFGLQLVTVFDDHVDITGLADTTFQSASFNGVRIVDLTGADFVAAAANGSSTVVGFDNSRVSIVGGDLFINMQELIAPEGSLARTDFRTDDAVPEPATLLLLSGGLLAGAARLRRRRA